LASQTCGQNGSCLARLNRCRQNGRAGWGGATGKTSWVRFAKVVAGGQTEGAGGVGFVLHSGPRRGRWVRFAKSRGQWARRKGSVCWVRFAKMTKWPVAGGQWLGGRGMRQRRSTATRPGCGVATGRGRDRRWVDRADRSFGACLIRQATAESSRAQSERRRRVSQFPVRGESGGRASGRAMVSGRWTTRLGHAGRGLGVGRIRAPAGPALQERRGADPHVTRSRDRLTGLSKDRRGFYQGIDGGCHGEPQNWPPVPRRLLTFCLRPRLPDLRIPLALEHGDHFDPVGQETVEHALREPLNLRLSDLGWL
jgi:hypothetical protein